MIYLLYPKKKIGVATLRDFFLRKTRPNSHSTGPFGKLRVNSACGNEKAGEFIRYASQYRRKHEAKNKHDYFGRE